MSQSESQKDKNLSLPANLLDLICILHLARLVKLRDRRLYQLSSVKQRV